MSTATSVPDKGELTADGSGGSQVDTRARSRALPLLALIVTVVVLGLLPVLQTGHFYFHDDSEAVFLPTWKMAGTDLLDGTWPTMRPDLWMGGNWAVEAQFGLWSPVNLVVMMAVALIPDLVVAATVVKIFFSLLLATGTYLLAREYGARAWPAMAVAAALPFTGFTLYFDTSTWIAGLMAFAWTPWFWWVARRVGRGVLNPVALFIVGYLLITNGNPYGALAAVIVLASLALEALLARDLRGLVRQVIAGAAVGATAAVAYLPLVLSSEVGWREASGIFNDGHLVPDLSMFAASSTPSAMPFIGVWVPGAGTTVPIAYSAWFLLPLLPWLRWSWLAQNARRLAGLGVVFGVYLMLAVGPSTLWLFRWPARLLEYVWLPTFVALALLISTGFVTEHWRRRAIASGAIVIVGAWLAFSAAPHGVRQHLVSMVLHAVLVAVLLWLVMRRPSLTPAAMVGGSALVLAAQLVWMPINRDVAEWRFPSDPASLEAYADEYRAPILQVASPVQIPAEDRPAAWSWLLFGSMPGATGVESTSSYSGIGHNAFSQALCMNHAGGTCPEALDRAFEPAGGLVKSERLVDALRVNTVVVARALVPNIDEFATPTGWERTVSNTYVQAFQRIEPLPWPDSRLAATTEDVTVASATATETTERLVLSTGEGGGAVQFARLRWPGYHATIAGNPVEVVQSPEGLVEVQVPPGLRDAEVTVAYDVPGYGVAIPLLIAAGALAVGQGVAWGILRRRGKVPVRAVPGAG